MGHFVSVYVLQSEADPERFYTGPDAESSLDYAGTIQDKFHTQQNGSLGKLRLTLFTLARAHGTALPWSTSPPD